ncbi:NnrS family protein [Skermanella mucosa]|uniref:NnrS family protein n=1 Tax=Skermanella mucosa TaxID=1789672 RepID=UPI00192ACAEA|nr:NnrS family protein [Skermanella mucosa]UEM18504.1 NnrS family protein [Skermanella mucosa]
MVISGIGGASGRPRRLVLFTLGFRPFYLLAAGLAVAWIPLWIGIWHGHLALPGSFAPPAWHAHEMLFGFTSAVLVGFLFTAIPNWTGRPTPTGIPLAGLAGIWLAGRASLLMDGLPWQAVAAIDVAFLPLAAAAMLPPLVATGNRRNIAFPFALMALGAANLLFHLDAAGMPVPAAEATRGVLGIMMVILVVMGGRVIPFFTANRLPEVSIRRSGRLDRCVTAAVVATAILSVAAPSTIVGGLAALAAAALLLYRGLRWMPWATRKHPMLWVLHAGHAWIAVALLLGAGSSLGLGLPAGAADHAFTIGGVGVLTLGMMARTARGHTGRPIEATRLMTAAFAIVNAAALVRVFGPMISMEWQAPAIGVSGVLWAVAFLLYLVEFAPILTSTRVDGRPG